MPRTSVLGTGYSSHQNCAGRCHYSYIPRHHNRRRREAVVRLGPAELATGAPGSGYPDSSPSARSEPRARASSGFFVDSVSFRHYRDGSAGVPLPRHSSTEPARVSAHSPSLRTVATKFPCPRMQLTSAVVPTPLCRGSKIQPTYMPTVC